MVSKTYGVDVASYQPTDLSSYHKAGASFAIVKLTEGTDYVNPKADAQVKSSRASHLYTHAYHFARFGSSVSQAKKEASYFIKEAKKEDISQKRMLWLDWESGSGNVVTGPKASNTAAILAFMDAIKAAGWRPGLYSGTSLLRTAIDTKQVVKRYGTCLWVASYPTMAPVSTADFRYFPSMGGVAIWQFTSNWKGLGVDGNVALVNLNQATEQKKVASKKKDKAKPKEAFTVYAPIINHDPNWKIALRDGNGHLTGKYIKTNSRWKVFDTKQMKGGTWYKLGTNEQWAPAAYLKKVVKAKAAAKDFKHVVRVNNLGPGKASWKVRLLSKDGHYTDRYVPQGSSWKTHKVMTIKGKKCYLIGKNLWIPDEFVTITK